MLSHLISPQCVVLIIVMFILLRVHQWFKANHAWTATHGHFHLRIRTRIIEGDSHLNQLHLMNCRWNTHINIQLLSPETTTGSQKSSSSLPRTVNHIKLSFKNVVSHYLFTLKNFILISSALTHIQNHMNPQEPESRVPHSQE